ncbi:MAG: hypothetical protein JRD89_01335 [Deltaproteobacteria bacterium]|nr:hypothetical protein [Deltaproteobacteria bacterium]
MQRNASIPLFFCLLSLVAAFSASSFTVRATDVDIDIYTTDDASIDVNMTAPYLNASINLNGVDVLEEKRDLESAFNAYVIAGWWSQQALDRIEELQERINGLIDDLNQIFTDVYGNLGYIYGVMGVTHNSTAVVQMLRDGNMTVAEYIDQQQKQLDTLAGELERLQGDVNLKLDDAAEQLNHLHSELAALDAETTTHFAMVDASLKELQETVHQQQNEISLLKTQYENLLIVCGALVLIAFMAILGMMKVRSS